MSTQNTVAQTLPIISDEDEAQIVAALAKLHAVIGNYGNPLPKLEEALADDAQRQRITNRAHKAIGALVNHRREEKVRAFRQGVADVVSPYVADAKTARTHFLAMPKEVRAFIPAFPSTVSIPVSEVASVFPTGTSEEHMNKFLHQLGYKLAKKEKAYYIVAELDSK